MNGLNPALRVAAENLLASEPDVADRLRRERRRLIDERRQMDSRVARTSGVHEMIERAQRDIESRTSPEIESLRAKVTALDDRLMRFVDGAASTAKHLRTVRAKGFDPTVDPITSAPGGLLDQFDQLRAMLTDLGVSYVGSDLEIEL